MGHAATADADAAATLLESPHDEKGRSGSVYSSCTLVQSDA